MCLLSLVLTGMKRVLHLPIICINIQWKRWASLKKKTLKQYFTRINIAHSLCLYLCVFYVQVTVTFEKGLCFCLLVGLLNTVISEQYVIYTKMAIILYLWQETAWKGEKIPAVLKQEEWQHLKLPIMCLHISTHCLVQGCLCCLAVAKGLSVIQQSSQCTEHAADARGLLSKSVGTVSFNR